MWHVSSRRGVATLRTAIHLLVTYLFTYTMQEVCQRNASIVFCSRSFADDIPASLHGMMECVPSANPGRRVGASLTRHHTALPPPHLCNDANWTGVMRLLRTGLRGRSISAAAAAAAAAVARAFQFGQESFDSIRFGNLINLPLVH